VSGGTAPHILDHGSRWKCRENNMSTVNDSDYERAEKLSDRITFTENQM
jgi:hypothetical protein